MKKFVILITIITLLVIFCSTGCENTALSTQNAQNAPTTKKIMVAVSIVPQQSFVKAVAGSLVDTVVLVPPGYSPENYAPSPRELIELSEASLYFSIGVPVENSAILPKLSGINKELKIVDLAGEAAKVYPEREFSPGHRDPHIWLSPKRVQVMVQAIARELAEIDPPNRDTYLKNAADYGRQLDELDRKITASLEHVAEKTFFVYHPAFGYFADDYGLTMIAVEEEGKEATIDDLKRIISLAKELRAKVVFYQAEMDSGQSKTIADEIGAKTEVVAPLAADYIENLEKMAKALSGL